MFIQQTLLNVCCASGMALGAVLVGLRMRAVGFSGRSAYSSHVGNILLLKSYEFPAIS